MNLSESYIITNRHSFFLLLNADGSDMFAILVIQVWELPVSVIFIVDMLVLTSNSVALKGYISESACLGA